MSVEALDWFARTAKGLADDAAFVACPIGRFVSHGLPGCFVLPLPFEGLDIPVSEIAPNELLAVVGQHQQHDPDLMQSSPSSKRSRRIPAPKQDQDLAGGHDGLPVESDQSFKLLILTSLSRWPQKVVHSPAETPTEQNAQRSRNRPTPT